MVRATLVVLTASALAQSVHAQNDPVPTFRVNVVARSTKAVNYQHRSGSTLIDFRGTAILPNGKGQAKVESKQGRIDIEANFSNLAPAYSLGQEYLTYVLWAITPEGRARNLGELLLAGQKSRIAVTSEFQVFGMIVTAEPYFAVTVPSDVIVMENEIRPDTRGRWDVVDAKYELLQRGIYAGTGSAQPPTWSPKIPIELIEARNAVRIAKLTAADRFAKDIFEKADKALGQAEDYHDRQVGPKPVAMLARESVQRAEDARVVSLRRQEEERLALERKQAAEREARARASAEAETKKREQAELDRAAAEKARSEAELFAKQLQQQKTAADLARLEAEKARAEAERLRKEAEEARAVAVAQQQQMALEAEKARKAAEESERLRLRAEGEKTQLRVSLREQLGLVLETRDSARGLIMNMSDVLFDTDQFTLKSDARERLARVAGIVLGHPGLKLAIEGHTDATGTDEHNQKLSEDRAGAVREYLLGQGLKTESVTASGYGKERPVASNDTAEGRRQNRRVEIVVSGDAIGAEAPKSESPTP